MLKSELEHKFVVVTTTITNLEVSGYDKPDKTKVLQVRKRTTIFIKVRKG